LSTFQNGISSKERSPKTFDFKEGKMKTCTLIGVMLLLAVVAHADKNVSLEELIENHTKAVGGKDAIEKVKTVEIKIQITEPTFQVNGIYQADRNKHMRIDIYNEGKWVFGEGFDGKNGWQRKKETGPAEPSSKDGSAALWHGTVVPGKLFGLHEMESIGNKVTSEGRETVDGINYHVIKLTLSDGYEKYYYIHPENWRIERSRDFKALHPDMDATRKWTESRFSDFRMQDGVLRSFHSEDYDLKSGEKIQTTTVESFNTNPKIDPKIFNAE
jgi:hypothetical protein